MTQVAALGDGPILFTNAGSQLEIPLSAIYFENNIVGTSLAAPPAGFAAWLQFLADHGRLVPGAVPPAATALVATAAVPGAWSNNIQVTVTPKAAAGTVDVTVSKTDQWDRLTIATLAARLGKSGAPGTEPGLLWVNDIQAGAAGAVPVASPPPPTGIAVTLPQPGDPPGTVPTWTIASTGGAAPKVVKLEARLGGPSFDPADFFVSISNVVPPDAAAVPPTPATFTLLVTWKRVASDVTTANIAAKLGGLGTYLVTFPAPVGGYKLPRPGTFTLSGGNDPRTVAATSASATIIANA